MHHYSQYKANSIQYYPERMLIHLEQICDDVSVMLTYWTNCLISIYLP